MKKIREFFQKRFRDKYKAFFYIALICAAIFLSCFVAASGRIGTLMAENHRLTSEKEETERTAQKEAEEMQQQITLLSNQIAEQVAKEEKEAEKFYPNGLPVSGKVLIVSMPGEEKKSEEGNLQGEAAPAPASEAYPQLVVFGAQNDAKVMAAGSGKVVETAPDPEFGYMVRIDHGNNYITIYRYNDLPKIKEGDDVTKGQLLFEVGFASDRVGYQIMYDKEYIDPMDVMEING